jgi:hypothetical protein
MAKETKKKPAPVAEEKKEEVTQEQMQQSAAQAIQAYFTREINEEVRDMTNDVMFMKLRNLEQSEYWVAILRYNNLRLLNAQSALNTLDPVTYPSAISKQQGAMMGLVDLQNAIIQMVEGERAAAKEMKEINEEF